VLTINHVKGPVIIVSEVLSYAVNKSFPSYTNSTQGSLLAESEVFRKFRAFAGIFMCLQFDRLGCQKFGYWDFLALSLLFT
jgi:hypothetical protein